MTDYIKRLLKPPDDHFFLLGPRGTGKSTWLLQAYPGATRIDLLLPAEERKFLAAPEKLREIVLAMPSEGVCIIDEIQRVPGLLPVVHSLIEENMPVQFIMTGSSARKLRKVIGNLLGGRALLRQMPPFWAQELQTAFLLQKALQVGMIPMIWQARDPLEKIMSYVGIYLKEEVQAEAMVRNVGDFARFLEIASLSQGNLWVSTDIANDAQIKRSTVDNYLQILEDLLLCVLLPVFTRRAKRAVIAHRKFYYFDAGVYRSLRPLGPLDWETEVEGVGLETLVMQHLRAWVQAQRMPHQLSFWRTRTQLEVDFVVYGPSGFWAIEVKRSANLAPADVRGLSAFQEEYPEAKCFIVYGGNVRLVYQSFLAIPISEFLLGLSPDRPILQA